MMNQNPYILQFGQEPAQIIPRNLQFEEVKKAFLSSGITQHIFMITGIRGSGKTVFMTKVSSFFLEENWIVINVNISSKISVMEQIAIELANHKKLKKHINFTSISTTIFGVGMEIKKEDTFTSYEYEVKKLLDLAKKLDLKILIDIDEVRNTESIREFAGAFQIWLREKYAVYLLMTGLYENIRELQNDKSLTFLYRTPRIDLSPLQLIAIKENYKKNLEVSEEMAIQMAKDTTGYSFAFQALGYVVWKHLEYNEEAFMEYKNILADFSYDKIWDELSTNDKKVCYAIARTEKGEYSLVKELLGWEYNKLNPYRKRLLDKQIINKNVRGYMQFNLPIFKEYILDKMEFEEDLV